jgi:lysophospholipase L1-like esterase
MNHKITTLTLCALASAVSAFALKPHPNLLQRGNFDNCRLVFEKEKKGHVAFMGGSITEMNGYRPILWEWLQKRFPKTKFTFTNAGISSTCSTTGAFRLQRDVLDHGPVDLFFVEFAVNDDQDAGHSREAAQRGMEGILRHLRFHNPNADVVVTYFVNPGMLKQLQEGKQPLPMAAHQEVLDHYGVSAVHLAKELADRIEAGTFTWSKFGGTHPKKPGNQLAADLSVSMLENSWISLGRKRPLAKKAVPHPVPEKLFNPHSYVKGRFLSPEKAKLEGGWKWSEPEWKKLSGGKRGRYLGKPLLHTQKPGSTAKLDFEGSAIGAFVLAGPDAGVLKFDIDGKVNGTVTLGHRYSRGLHYPRSVMFAHDLKPGKHTISLTLSEKGKAEGKTSAARILQFCVN